MFVCVFSDAIIFFLTCTFWPEIKIYVFWLYRGEYSSDLYRVHQSTKNSDKISKLKYRTVSMNGNKFEHCLSRGLRETLREMARNVCTNALNDLLVLNYKEQINGSFSWDSYANANLECSDDSGNRLNSKCLVNPLTWRRRHSLNLHFTLFYLLHMYNCVCIST